ncbi:trehalose-phosphatase [Mycolicibacterium thermoresistibile]
MTASVVIDPRFHDAVLFELGAVVDAAAGDGAGARVSDSAIILADKLRNAGIAVAVFAPDGDGADLMHAAGIDDLFGVAVGGVSGDPPGGSRTVALAAAERVNAAPERTVIIGRTGTSRHYGGFAFVAGVDDFAEAVVRDRYRTVSALSNALASYGLLIGIVANRQPVVFCRFDGALADRDTATLVDGAAAALRKLASLCPVAVISGREVSELRARVGVDGLWYAGGHGREVVAPDGSHHHFDGTDWDPGAALTSIRARMGRPEPVLPIYVGSELADEAAFDVLRLDGVSVVVHHLGAADRPTGAQFRLDGAEEVCEFLRRGGNWIAYQRQTSNEAWTFSYRGYDPRQEKLREALCTVGNGYFATRGAAPEARAGQVHYPGTYAAGVFNRLDDVVDGRVTAHESMVNLPNWLPLTFRIEGGPWFDVDAVTLLDYRQTLDLRGAVLTRELRFRDNAGRTTSVTQQRFVAMHTAHIAALETTLVAEDWSGTVDVRSTLDGDVRNGLVERYRDLRGDHLESLGKSALTGDSVLLSVRTNQSRIPIAMAARTTAWRDGDPVSAGYRLVDEESEIGHQITTGLSRGQRLTVEKVVALSTGRDVGSSEPSESAERILERQGRFGEIRAAHTVAWAHLWRRLSIEFEDHTDELRVMRLHLLHLLQTVSPHSADLDIGPPARGLHGEAYRGHIFWDELFIFPVLNLRFPMITRSLLQYRYRRLPEARRAARLAGYRGAMFPWQSGSDGREESPELHLNPRSGRWNPDPSHRAHHIGIAIAYNVWQFYQVTGDLAYLIDHGAELLVEIARFWVSRAEFDTRRGRYRIRGVIGPDEFHAGYPDRPYDGVDDNAYTNVMAVWVILRALEALNLIPLPNRIDVREKLNLTAAELAQWDDVSRRMYVPFHDGIISQFEGYGELAELDWDGYRRRYGNIQRLDRILEAEGDDVNRYKASKQADALMLLYLLSADELRELLGHLGYRFTAEQIPGMVDYYLARTSHGSTLSAVVHAWVLARANRDRAMEYFERVLKSDVADIQGGTTAEGIHLAAMAGSVDLVQRCFTGLETRSDRIVLSPNWPESLGALGFPIRYRGHQMYVRVSGRGAEISVAPRDLPPVAVECNGRVQRLEPGTTVRFT